MQAVAKVSSEGPVVAASGTKSRPEHVLAAQTFFIRSFLHFARNAILGLPCRPFASACLEHSSESAVRGFVGIVVLGAVFGVILPTTGGLAVGEGVVPPRDLPFRGHTSLASPHLKHRRAEIA